MRKWFFIGGVLLLLLGGLIVYKAVNTPSIVNQTKEVAKSKEAIEESVEIYLSGEEVDSEHLMHEYGSPEGTIEYFFSIATLNEVGLLPDVVSVEQLNEDFFSLDVSERIPQMKKTISMITKKQTLEKVEVVRGMWTLEMDSIRVVTDLFYTDIKDPIRVNIKLRKKEVDHVHGDKHADSNKTHELYYIDSSLLDLAKQIEKEE
jgi:hypothetical protein